MKIWKHSVLFYLGGMTYQFLEYLWRGRSHGSMFLLGGLCFTLIGQITRRLRLPLWLQLLMSSSVITLLELLTGLLVNRDHSVWDYRGMPYHYLGQICLNYSLLWIPVSLGAITLYRWLEPRLNP